ncbi:hypothetical protein Hanom_Chr06g00569261 [Helianthus anomalus]
MAKDSLYSNFLKPKSILIRIFTGNKPYNKTPPKNIVQSDNHESTTSEFQFQ